MCTTISAAKHQDSNNSLKIKFKALKELEKGTPPQRCCFTFWCAHEDSLHMEKKTEQFFQSYESSLGAKGEKREKKMRHLTRY